MVTVLLQFMLQCQPFYVSGFNTEDLASKALISGRSRGHVIADYTTIGAFPAAASTTPSHAFRSIVEDPDLPSFKTAMLFWVYLTKRGLAKHV